MDSRTAHAKAGVCAARVECCDNHDHEVSEAKLLRGLWDGWMSGRGEWCMVEMGGSVGRGCGVMVMDVEIVGRAWVGVGCAVFLLWGGECLESVC